jgi:uncharacterized protein YoxC
MADDVSISSQGRDGNGVKVDLREKKFALTGPNVALLMLILIIGGVAYIRTGTIDKTMKAGQEQLAATESRVQQRVSELFGRMDKLLDDLQAQNVLLAANNAKVTAGQHDLQAHVDEGLTKQNDMVHQQTNAIFEKVATLEKSIDGRFAEIGQRLEMLNWNIVHPEKALPLRAPLPREERHPERER